MYPSGSLANAMFFIYQNPHGSSKTIHNLSASVLGPPGGWGESERGAETDLPIGQLLLELDSQLLEPLARSLDVLHRDRDVPKPASRLRVSVRVALEVRVGFGSVLSPSQSHIQTQRPSQG